MGEVVVVADIMDPAKGGTPGAFLVDYVARAEAAEALPMGPAATGDALDGVLFGGERGLPWRLAMTGEEAAAAGARVQRAFDRGAPVTRLVVSLANGSLEEEGASTLDDGRGVYPGCYRGRVDQGRVRTAVCRAMGAVEPFYRAPFWAGAVHDNRANPHAHVVLVDEAYDAPEGDGWQVPRQAISALKAAVADGLAMTRDMGAATATSPANVPAPGPVPDMDIDEGLAGPARPVMAWEMAQGDLARARRAEERAQAPERSEALREACQGERERADDLLAAALWRLWWAPGAERPKRPWVGREARCGAGRSPMAKEDIEAFSEDARRRQERLGRVPEAERGLLPPGCEASAAMAAAFAELAQEAGEAPSASEVAVRAAEALAQQREAAAPEAVPVAAAPEAEAPEDIDF